jgi:hypothetical protein
MKIAKPAFKCLMVVLYFLYTVRSIKINQVNSPLFRDPYKTPVSNSDAIAVQNDPNNPNNVLSEARYDRQTTLELARNLLVLAMPDVKTKQPLINSCFQSLSANSETQDEHIKRFFEAAKLIYRDINRLFSPEIFSSIFSALSNYEYERVKCDTAMFPLKQSGYNYVEINNAMNRVFEGYNIMRNVNNYDKITHNAFDGRSKLPGDYFTTLNKVSRQENMK